MKTYYEKGDVGPYTIVYIEEEAIKLYLMMDSGVSEVKRHGWELRLLVQPATVSYVVCVYNHNKYFFSCRKGF